MVRLSEVTKDNLEALLELKISEKQEGFVSSVANSLAQAYVYHETAFPFAIYDDDIVVGFIMFGFYEARDQYTLWKFLIDEHFQNMGYGKAALEQGLSYMKERFATKEIYTGVALGNDVAKRLYISLGFEQTGLIEDNMEELKYIYEQCD
ncbi:MAG: GNAT family N-acetyltransferase [Oscillospiraceae bacterium]|nr:GNAT family N-acetyltransferase [Oscillospiraceae bacterium]